MELDPKDLEDMGLNLDESIEQDRSWGTYFVGFVLALLLVFIVV
jgi:Mg2+ and Co2+ transporter CorA